MWITPVTLEDATVRVFRMARPSSIADAHYGAVVRTSAGVLRYFVAEQGAGRVHLAEWRSPTERIKYGPLDEFAVVDVEPATPHAQPREVSSDAIRGLAYLASFLDAIRVELGGRPRPQAPPSYGPSRRMAYSANMSANESPVHAAIVRAIGVLVLLALVGFMWSFMHTPR